jgi:hypothetical protein
MIAGGRLRLALSAPRNAKERLEHCLDPACRPVQLQSHKHWRNKAMRIISAAIAAAFLAVSSAAFAAVPAPVDSLKSQPAIELIKKGKKAAKKAKKGKKAKKASSKAGKCGAGKYWKKGKCLNAADKKPK